MKHKYLLLIVVLLVLCGCVAGPFSVGVNRTKTISKKDNNTVVTEEVVTINETISQSIIATVAVAISKQPIAAAIVAGAQSIGNALGKFVEKGGDNVNNIVDSGIVRPLSANSNSSAKDENEFSTNKKQELYIKEKEKKND